MIIYEANKTGFLRDVQKGVIADNIYSKYKEVIGRTEEGQFNSWRNSMEFMGDVMNDDAIPESAHVAIEYRLPYSAKRVDFMISGTTADGQDSVIIVELKQWSHAQKVDGKEDVVTTELKRGKIETAHPSYQAWSYKEFIEHSNRTVQDKPVLMYPCAYMHNYTTLVDAEEHMTDPQVFPCIDKAPVFIRPDTRKLTEFIAKYIHKGDPDARIMYEIEYGRIHPSKALQDAVASMIDGNQEFVMIDTQKVIYETALNLELKTRRSEKKQVLIIKGGPGTGKSVLAVNLLAYFNTHGRACHYVTKNSAPRSVYAAELTKDGKKKYFISNLFKSSDVYFNSRLNDLDVLLVDEAHRLRLKSGIFSNKGENQTKEIIRAARLAVFFIDEEQRVTAADAGSVAEIKKFAKEAGAAVTVLELDSQFRCNGSDGYLAWVDNVLGIKDTANALDYGQDYDFKVFDSPTALRREIESKNQNNKARLVAGYCWEWIKTGKDDPEVDDIVIPETGFKASWNLNNSSTWAIDPDSVKQVGCIHTCQGLEFDYVGVIIGDDLRYENGKVITDFTKRAHSDKSLNGLLGKARQRGDSAEKRQALKQIDQIIRNTYRTLLTRGMKGCYVYCTNKALAQYLKDTATKTQQNMQFATGEHGTKMAAER